MRAAANLYHTDHALTRAELGDKRSPWSFEQQGTRELVADDFVYALKRHATTRIEGTGVRRVRRIPDRPEGVRAS